nr:hypothetical protein Itr_chr09CG15330 [Ipomoea trifida]
MEIVDEGNGSAESDNSSLDMLDEVQETPAETPPDMHQNVLDPASEEAIPETQMESLAAPLPNEQSSPSVPTCRHRPKSSATTIHLWRNNPKNRRRLCCSRLWSSLCFYRTVNGDPLTPCRWLAPSRDAGSRGGCERGSRSRYLPERRTGE